MPVTYETVNVPVVVGAATLRGKRGIVTPHMPWSGDVSAAATTYRARNGATSRYFHAWRGVKYAEPPIGARRFKPALDYDYPAGTFDLFNWPNVPMQTGGQEGGTSGRFPLPTVGSQNWRGMGVQESEDCLTLNIFRPAATAPAGGWPIIVWVHGGGWTQNSAIQFQWRPEHLVTKGCLVITVEYRLSVFGHFWHPDWEAEEDWAGPSMALTDVKSALRWVNRNIAAFGGNPAKVTLGGSSAGGECTLALLEDASTAGLFRNAWVSSGGGIGDRDKKGTSKTSGYLGYAQEYARLHTAIQAIAPFTRDYSNPLRSVADAIEADGFGNALRTAVAPDVLLSLLNRLWDTVDDVSTAIRGQYSDGRWTPTRPSDYNRYPWFGGGLVHRSSIEAAKAGAYTRPLVVTAAQDESNVISGQSTTNLVRNLGVFDEAEWMAQPYVDAVEWSETQRREIAWSNSTFQYPAWRIARGVTQTGGTAWLGFWAFTGSNRGTAGHSSELGYLFGNPNWNCPKTGGADGENELDIRSIDMSNRMMQAIANLAANNSPNTLYTHAADFSLFAAPAYFTMAPYNTSTPEHWNVIGANSLTSAEGALVSCVHATVQPGAWLDYLSRLG